MENTVGLPNQDSASTIESTDPLWRYVRPAEKALLALLDLVDNDVEEGDTLPDPLEVRRAIEFTRCLAMYFDGARLVNPVSQFNWIHPDVSSAPDGSVQLAFRQGHGSCLVLFDPLDREHVLCMMTENKPPRYEALLSNVAVEAVMPILQLEQKVVV